MNTYAVKNNEESRFVALHVGIYWGLGVNIIKDNDVINVMCDSKIMFKNSEHTPVFDRAMKHIKYAVNLKKKLNLKVTLGIQMVLLPEFNNNRIVVA